MRKARYKQIYRFEYCRFLIADLIFVIRQSAIGNLQSPMFKAACVSRKTHGKLLAVKDPNETPSRNQH
jgi:hypothetical protein